MGARIGVLFYRALNSRSIASRSTLFNLVWQPFPSLAEPRDDIGVQAHDELLLP
jgi:hypothetical protein